MRLLIVDDPCFALHSIDCDEPDTKHYVTRHEALIVFRTTRCPHVSMNDHSPLSICHHVITSTGIAAVCGDWIESCTHEI